MLPISIKNKQIKSIYERNRAIFYDDNLHEKIRINAYEKMRLIEAMVSVYENSEKLHTEEMDDLFLMYDEDFRPTFPEELRALFKK